MNKRVLPVVIPMEELTEGIVQIDRMFVEELYFAQDAGWREKHSANIFSLPLFMLLDGSNKVLVVSNNRNEILQACNANNY